MNKEFQLKRRLKLARDILEAPEKIPAFDKDGIIDLPNGGWSHVRHDWESVCVYLLLTCFDLIGQSGEFINFQDWLKSKREQHRRERAEAAASIRVGDDCVTSSLELYRYYNKIYGIKNSFHNGILSLEPDDRRKLLDSIWVRFQEDYDPKVSTVARPVEWDSRKLDMKRMDFIYNQRNIFTHRLQTNFHMSGPSPGVWNGNPVGSYHASIHEDQVFFGTSNSHYEISKNLKKRYIYTTLGWPFILMEVLYNHLGESFSRYDLSLSVHLQVWGVDPKHVHTFPNVPFSLLKDPDAIREAVRSKMS